MPVGILRGFLEKISDMKILALLTLNFRVRVRSHDLAVYG